MTKYKQTFLISFVRPNFKNLKYKEIDYEFKNIKNTCNIKGEFIIFVYLFFLYIDFLFMHYNGFIFWNFPIN